MAVDQELRAAFTQQQSDTKEVSALTGSEKREVIESIFPNGVAIDVNDPNLKVADKVFGEKANINNGNWFFGNVLTAPPTQDSHIEFKYRKL